MADPGIPPRMRALRWHGPSDVRVEEVATPAVAPGSLLVRVRAAAVCGSDFRIFAGGNERIAPPRILGHEIAGEVVAVGAGAEGFAIGDRVAVGADVPCEGCGHCDAGRPNCCDVNLAIGYQYEGGFAEYILLDPLVVRKGPVAVFPASVDFARAALAEPLGCCLNGFERVLAVGSPKGAAAIFGAGPVGLMLGQLARHHGFGPVIALEPDPTRRADALAFGADFAFDPSGGAQDAVQKATGGCGCAAVFTACPASSTHELAQQIVGKRGVINLFGGLPKTAAPVTLFSNLLHYREAYVTGSHGSTPAHHRAALALIASGKIDAARLITHRIGLDALPGLLAAGAPKGSRKIVVEPA